MITVCIVDDQRSMHEALRLIINDVPDILLLKSYYSAEEFINDFSSVNTRYNPYGY